MSPKTPEEAFNWLGRIVLVICFLHASSQWGAHLQIREDKNAKIHTYRKLFLGCGKGDDNQPE
jgi:hypothetical protein